MPDLLYVPMLKGRQGEFSALTKIKPETRNSCLPLIEIVPGPEDEPAAIREVIKRTTRKLVPWAGSRLLLDAGLVRTDVAVHNSLGALGHAVSQTAEHGVVVTPVVRLSDDELVHLDAATTHADWGGGVAIRLNTEDMEEDVDDINSALVNLLARLNIETEDVDLVLDLGAVEDELAVRAGARLVRDVLRDLSNIDNWRQIVVSAGAFPPNLSAVEPWRFGELPRYDAELWDHLGGRRITRVPTYGDYAVAHPLFAAGPLFPAAPQLRYTVADRWLALKGRRNDPRGHEQFYVICEQIASHPEFAGAALSQADARISDAGNHGGPGNASTWREIGTTHHLDFVVSRLTNLGEP